MKISIEHNSGTAGSSREARTVQVKGHNECTLDPSPTSVPAGEPAGEITLLLQAMKRGDRSAQERLIPLVYPELCRTAERFMRWERSDHTLQPTALVHEAFLRVVDQRHQDWENRTQFYGLAAHLMRLILIDHAKKVGAKKRPPRNRRVQLDKIDLSSEEQLDDLIALDEALNELGKVDPRAVQVIEMRFFSEMSVEDTAAALGVSARTVKRDLRTALPYLRATLTYEGEPNRGA
jgi:RNA polymerase sigma factor (TIGR02999 family)